MKCKNILLVIIIGILSINLVFANSAMAKKYMISGDLIIAPTLNSLCSAGTGNWDDGVDIDYDDAGDTSMFSRSVGNILNKLFFSQIQYTPLANSCRVEIYSPNNTLVKEVGNLNAQAIKDGLKKGIVTPAINVSPSSTDKLDFVVKIILRKPSNVDETLLETTVSVPNINDGLTISADTVSAIINENTTALNAGASPVLMITKSGTSNYETKWKRLSGNNILPNSINALNLYTINGEDLTNKNNWVLSINNETGLMNWTLVGEQNIAPNSISTQHLSDNIIQQIDSKVGKLVHTTNKNAGTTEVIKAADGTTVIPIADRDTKYFKIPVTDSTGNTTTYLLPVFILTSENPILDIPQSKITLGVGGGVPVDATINDLKSTITKTVTNNGAGAGYITVTDPTIITLNGIQKARVDIHCNSYVPTGTTLPRITLSGNSKNNNILMQDYFDVNCTASPNSYINITTTGSQVTLGQSASISAVGDNISNVTWAVTAGNTATIGAGTNQGNTYTVPVGCSSVGSNVIRVTANKLVGGTVSDSIGISCIDSGTNPGGSCFKEGTKIYTTNGWKNIETIKGGDKVYSYSDSGKLVETNVKALLIHNELREGDDSVKLELSNNKVLFVTTNHAFYSPDDLDYKALRKFNIGDNLLYFNNITNTFEKVKITNITILPPFNISYNLAIDSPNNYLAEGIVVHNDRKHGDPIDNTSTGTGGTVQ